MAGPGPIISGHKTGIVPMQGEVISFKVVLLGDNYVGKSWLMHRYFEGPINKVIGSTIGAAFSAKMVPVDHDMKVRLAVWDTAGSERYDSMTRMCCRGAQFAAIVVYDITNERTFEKAKIWVNWLQEQDSSNIFIALAGNKSDFVSGREVKYEDAQSYADDNNLMFMEVSAKTGENVENIFLTVGYNLWMAHISAVPKEILAQGRVAKLLYERALLDGSVNVYRGRILLIGQDRAGKTSLKKSLLGLPFDPKEQSTEGIEVDPSKCNIDVEQVKNWNSTGENKPSLSEYSKDISRMLAEKRYHWILNEAKKDSGMESEEELESEEKSEVESIMNLEAEDKNSSQVSDLKNPDVSDVKNTDVSSPASEMQVQAKANSAANCRTDDGSVSASEQSELVIDATSPPDDVTKQADKLWKYMFLESLDAENADHKKASVVTVDLWDFAGQHLYYASHPVFMSSRAVYVLVHNLSKPLNAPAQPCVRQGTHDVILENPNNETNLENLLSWLVTVHSIKPTGEGMVDKSERMLPYLRPPVFIVGTHADKPFDDPKTMTSTIQQGISGKEYEKHVIRPFFNIDNRRRNPSLKHKIKKLLGMHPQGSHQAGQGDDTSGDGIDALRTKIMEVLREEPYMGETIPVRWFKFEKVVEALVAKNIYHMSLEQLQTYAKEVCFMEDEDQFHAMLNFYHDLGMIVKHRSTVILKAQWLIDLFKKLITIPPFDKVDPLHSKYWQEVETSGVLSMELVDLVFSRFIQQGVFKEDILDMMERFGLIAKFSPSPTDVKYFVPAQLKSSPEHLCKMEPSPTDPCPLYLHFAVDGFVPHGLFSRLVSRSTSWCSDIGSTQPPNLYQNGAWFVIGQQIIHHMILICKKRFIKILLKQRSQEEAVSVSTSAEVARSVRLFMEGSLKDLSQELPYLSGLQYKFCVACPYCLQESHECANHSQPSCAHEDCLHFLEIKQGERLICMKNVKNVSAKEMSVRGLEKWFSQTTSQDLSPCASTVVGTSQGSQAQGNPGTSDTTLRRTLLASEWSSSMGGLSTINRQLAILLAEHMHLEVTLFIFYFCLRIGHFRLFLFQNESWCAAFVMEMSFVIVNYNSFPYERLCTGLVLKQRQKATRKWPIGISKG